MTNTNQTNWYQNLIENIQEQEWYQKTVFLGSMLGIVGAIFGPSLIKEYLNPTPNYSQQQLVVLTQALQIEQHNNPSNAQAIANQFGGMSNLEQAVSNYVNNMNLDTGHNNVLNLNSGNVHLDSLVCGTANYEAVVNLTYHTHETQPVSGTKGLIWESVTNNHTMAISQGSVNLALKKAPLNKLKGGNWKW